MEVFWRPDTDFVGKRPTLTFGSILEETPVTSDDLRAVGMSLEATDAFGRGEAFNDSFTLDSDGTFLTLVSFFIKDDPSIVSGSLTSFPVSLIEGAFTFNPAINSDFFIVGGSASFGLVIIDRGACFGV